MLLCVTRFDGCSTSDSGEPPRPQDLGSALITRWHEGLREAPHKAMDETSRLVTSSELVSVSVYNDQGLSRRPGDRRNAVIAAQAPTVRSILTARGS
jgi:hypothetical protein